MTIWEINPDPDADPSLPFLPLRGEVTTETAKDLIRSGKGTHCGECGKPFTLARKRRGVGRVRHLDAAGRLYSTSWIFCGRCHAAMQHNDGKVSEKLVEESRQAVKAAQLALCPARGNA